MTIANRNLLAVTGRAMLTAAALLFVAAAHNNACAQTVVVIVNGEPITALDLEQRMKFVHVTSQKTPGRQETLEDLINEKLKIKEAKRWGIDIPDSEVESSYARMASNMRF